MSSNRIQKLLFSEYSDLEDVVLVEGPFAETSRQGEGIRQVQIGLTPSKLILASYSLKAVDEFSENVGIHCGVDPDIENFELVSAYPVECVNLSVFRRGKRKALKARFCNGVVAYYEIGGWHERKMLWSVWRERIKFLSPHETRASVSETSVASSSSGGSLYIVRSSLSVSQSGQPTLWCHFAKSDSTDSHFHPEPPLLEKVTLLPENRKKVPFSTSKNIKSRKKSSKEPVTLTAEHELIAREAVELWESKRGIEEIDRPYGFCPFPGLLGGLGLWHFSKFQSCSLQTKRSVSMVHLAQTGRDVSNQLSLSWSQLTRTVSQEALAVPAFRPNKLFQMAKQKPYQNYLHFWTSEAEQKLEWNRKQYKAQRRRLRLLARHSNTGSFEKKRRRKGIIKVYTKATKNFNHNIRIDSSSETVPGGGDCCISALPLGDREQSFEVTGCRWAAGIRRFSYSLAHQLTMIDKYLFLQLNTLELGRLMRDRCSCRSPHMRALMLFSYRISCLVATHIISGYDVKERAVLIAKYIGVVYKCHKLHNLQSAVSVLQGLQCPAVYRLHDSWTYVRANHASKYRRFKDLSLRYFDPHLPLYRQTYDNLTERPPYLPSVALLVEVLLKRMPELPGVKKSSRSAPEYSKSCLSLPSSTPAHLPKSSRRILSAFNVHCQPTTKSTTSIPQILSCQSKSHLHSLSIDTLLNNLDKFFSPVSGSCPMTRHLQDVEYFLENNQAAATRYTIPINSTVRIFLLHSRYYDMERLFSVSRQLEP